MKEMDPVEELHQIRQKLYKDAGGTPKAFVRYIMERQKQYADRLVDLSKPGMTQNKSRKNPTKPAARVSSRKPKQRRKTVAP